MPAPNHFMANPGKPVTIDGRELTAGMHLIMAVCLIGKQRGSPVISKEDCFAVVKGAELLIGEMLDQLEAEG